MFKIGTKQTWPFKVPFLKNILEHAVHEKLLRLRSAQERIDQARREEIQRVEFAHLLGQPVLVFSNEWKEPMVGIFVRMEEVQHHGGNQSSLPVVEEAFTRETFWVGGIIRPLSISMLKAVDKLDPSERWMLASRYGSQIPRPSSASSPAVSLYERIKNETDYFERFKLEENERALNNDTTEQDNEH